ncbi:hypothetical protein [Paraburkholderia ferrariae]|uniref:hypothetical protein n=1 Tax=Paraburkholderia ferrariae TaxID=386056 RepID=UPI0005AA0ED2|nr:hypothetical protein [Paraburkholderia ferrariae]
MQSRTLLSLLVPGTDLSAVALVVATAVLSAPAFASGYGPASSYNPAVGAPASQRGVSALTVQAEERAADTARTANETRLAARGNSAGGASPAAY